MTALRESLPGRLLLTPVLCFAEAFRFASRGVICFAVKVPCLLCRKKMISFREIKAFTFDCYGTLIDWETGIFSALHPILKNHGRNIGDATILETYGELELRAETGPYRRYREVLASVVEGFGEKLGFTPTTAETASLAESVGGWPPFPDTVESLRKLAARYRLAVVSNIDDDLFAQTAPKLGVSFDQVVTAQQAGSYKPSLNNFHMVLERLRLAPSQVLHAGQSIFHDVVPAKSLGITTVWVNRASARPCVGAVIQAQGQPHLEVPDLESLARLAIAE